MTAESVGIVAALIGPMVLVLTIIRGVEFFASVTR